MCGIVKIMEEKETVGWLSLCQMPSESILSFSVVVNQGHTFAMHSLCCDRMEFGDEIEFFVEIPV